MDGFIHGAEHHQAQHTSVQLAPDHLSQQMQGQSDRSSDYLHRRATATASSDQGIPALPDESTIRAHPPMPALKPFYSVISDATESPSFPETYYPRVRYIFNDDDPDLLTDAFATQQRTAHAEASQIHTTRSGPGSGTETTRPPDRSLLLDLDPTPDGRGYTVSCATSLATDWAITNAQVQRLQTSPPSDNRDNEGDHTMVLRVEGLGLPTGRLITGKPTEATPAMDRASPYSLQSEKVPNDRRQYSGLVHSFEERMAVLQHVVRNSEDSKPPLLPESNS